MGLRLQPWCMRLWPGCSRALARQGSTRCASSLEAYLRRSKRARGEKREGASLAMMRSCDCSHSGVWFLL